MLLLKTTLPQTRCGSPQGLPKAEYSHKAVRKQSGVAVATAIIADTALIADIGIRSGRIRKRRRLLAIHAAGYWIANAFIVCVD